MTNLIVAFRNFANAPNSMTLSVNVQPHVYQAQEPRILPHVIIGWNDAQLLQNVVLLICMRFVKSPNISWDTDKPHYSRFLLIPFRQMQQRFLLFRSDHRHPHHWKFFLNDIIH